MSESSNQKKTDLLPMYKLRETRRKMITTRKRSIPRTVMQ